MLQGTAPGHAAADSEHEWAQIACKVAGAGGGDWDWDAAEMWAANVIHFKVCRRFHLEMNTKRGLRLRHRVSGLGAPVMWCASAISLRISLSNSLWGLHFPFLVFFFFVSFLGSHMAYRACCLWPGHDFLSNLHLTHFGQFRSGFVSPNSPANLRLAKGLRKMQIPFAFKLCVKLRTRLPKLIKVPASWPAPVPSRRAPLARLPLFSAVFLGVHSVGNRK